MIILDLETTGLDPEVHEIIEIGAVNTETGETFEAKVMPLKLSDADPESLRVNGFDKDQWLDEAFLLPNALLLLSQFVGEGEYMAGYNVSFDRMFLEHAYAYCNMQYPFHHRHIDLMSIAWRMSGAPVPFSLAHACAHFGVPPEPATHRALCGAITTAKLANIIL